MPISTQKTEESRMARLRARAQSLFSYVTEGVWQDSRNKWWVKLVKVVNLTIRGFLDGDLQSKACAMTYRTMLALVPLLALLFAIGNGFGLGNYLQNELYHLFPSQHRALEVAFRFVDSYLSQTSEGIFVGAGIIFLLWTLVSLLSSVEEVFNSIWNVKTTRTLWRKLSDYTAILLILPILMICSSGISIFMSTTLHSIFNFEFMTPVISALLDFTSIVLSWLCFAGCYAFIPNTRVKFTNALVSGILAGSGFQLLQWLFVTGQMYVAKYNAIYGSFSFLPLLLIWMQLVWLITFIGAGICYSSQNIFRFNFESRIQHISAAYRTKVTLAVLTVIVQRFKQNQAPISTEEIVTRYGLPPKLVDYAVTLLMDANLISYILPKGSTSATEPDKLPLAPAHDPDMYLVGDTINTLDNYGDSGFIPGFENRFPGIDRVVEQIEHLIASGEADIPLTTLEINHQPASHEPD